jgi:DNA-binding NarL/FixJ family response regulator
MRRILIVEDNKDFADLLQESLSDEPDFQVMEVIGTESAVYRRFEENLLDDLECLLLDLHLPTEDGDRSVYSAAGLRILAQARQRYHFNGTVIVLTSSRDLDDGRRALAGGCDGYLCKYAPLSEMSRMFDELKVALRGNVTMVSHEMRHVFLRDDISGKEAKLMDMLSEGCSWAEIARKLDYKTPKAAANTGDRIYDKLLSAQPGPGEHGSNKRERAIEVWKARRV